MRQFVILILSVVLMFTTAFAHENECGHNNIVIKSSDVGGDWFFDDCASFDIDNGSIIIEFRNRDHTTVEITEDYQLLVDDEIIDLNTKQQKLVEQFYDGSMLLIEHAINIGLRGAGIGMEGAKIGISAMTGLIKVMLTDYEMDDLEYDIERQADELEEQADILDEQGEVIDDIANDLEDSYKMMCRNIPELDNIDRSRCDDNEI